MVHRWIESGGFADVKELCPGRNEHDLGGAQPCIDPADIGFTERAWPYCTEYTMASPEADERLVPVDRLRLNDVYKP